MKNILLPTDFSENSWNAMDYAIKFHKYEKCTFYLLHVVPLGSVAPDIPYIPNPIVMEETYINPSKIRLRQLLKRISKEFPKHRHHKFYSLLSYNFLIDALKKEVEEKKITLIIMGTKGASGLKEKLVGSNAGEVITKLTCTTLIVPENARFKALQEVAFPTDFKVPFKTKVVSTILELLEKKSAALRIVHMSKLGTVLSTTQQNNKDSLEDLLQKYPHSFHTLTHKKIEEAVQCFVESRAIDMIVMLAKNLTYFEQLFFHSKVEKISYHTNVPFLVLHE